MTDIVDYKLWETPTRARIHDVYAEMRRVDPVHLAYGPVTGNPFWFLTRYDDCVALLKDPRFGKDMFKSLPPDVSKRYGEPPADDDPMAAVNRHMLNLDPPDHTRLRSLVHKAFTPRMIDNLLPRIESITESLLDEIESGPSEFDLIESFGYPLPITVIAEMLGVRAEDRDSFRRWTRILLFGNDQEQAQIAAMEFVMYIHGLIEARQTHPEDDLMTALIQAEEAGDKLDHQELLSMIFLLLVAGHETTVNLIGNGTLALLRHRDQFDKLRDNPELIRSAIEEMLRYDGPVETTTLRVASDDIELHGRHIQQGDGIMAALLAANRDPAQFPDPDRFDIEREPNRHIAFGNGIHYCLGAPLARMEGAIAINALLRRVPTLELAVEPDALEWNPSLLLHGLAALPVRR
jgi:cytochrome P450 PksS